MARHGVQLQHVTTCGLGGLQLHYFVCVMESFTYRISKAGASGGNIAGIILVRGSGRKIADRFTEKKIGIDVFLLDRRNEVCKAKCLWAAKANLSLTCT